MYEAWLVVKLTIMRRRPSVLRWDLPSMASIPQVEQLRQRYPHDPSPTVVPAWHDSRSVVQPSSLHAAHCRPPHCKLVGVLRPAASVPDVFVI